MDLLSWKRVLCNRPRLSLSVRPSIRPPKLYNLLLSDLCKILHKVNKIKKVTWSEFWNKILICELWRIKCQKIVFFFSGNATIISFDFLHDDKGHTMQHLAKVSVFIRNNTGISRGLNVKKSSFLHFFRNATIILFIFCMMIEANTVHYLASKKKIQGLAGD